MILPIYVYGQPVLRKVAEDIAPDYPNLKELIENMLLPSRQSPSISSFWRKNTAAAFFFMKTEN